MVTGRREVTRGRGGGTREREGGTGAREGGLGSETMRRRMSSVTPEQREEAWGRLVGGPNKEKGDARGASGMFQASAKAIAEHSQGTASS